jgi:Kelch motif
MRSPARLQLGNLSRAAERVEGDTERIRVADQVYVLGGYDTERHEVRTVFVLERDRWRKALQLPRPLHAFDAVAFRGEIWVIGGRRGERQLSEVWILHPQSGRWRAGPPLPKPMELLGAAAVGDESAPCGSGRTRSTMRRRVSGETARPARVAHAPSLFEVGGTLCAVGGCRPELRATAVVERHGLS